MATTQISSRLVPNTKHEGYTLHVHAITEVPFKEDLHIARLLPTPRHSLLKISSCLISCEPWHSVQSQDPGPRVVLSHPGQFCTCLLDRSWHVMHSYQHCPSHGASGFRWVHNICFYTLEPVGNKRKDGRRVIAVGEPIS